MRGFALILLACFSTWSWGTPEILKSFHQSAELNSASKLAGMKCLLCHTKPPIRNAFGRDVEEEIESARPQLMTAALWRDLSAKDSDGDGASNGEEIKADTAPGDPQSTPPPAAPTTSAESAPIAPKASSTSDEMIPKHSFHPALVHFPIALVLFGVVLEIFGFRRQDSGIRRAGWLSLLWGTLFMIPTLFTGLRAFFQLEMKWEGEFLIHFIAAVLGLLLSSSAVLWRRKGETDSPAYFALLILAALSVGVAGHFGAMMVFG